MVYGYAAAYTTGAKPAPVPPPTPMEKARARMGTVITKWNELAEWLKTSPRSSSANRQRYDIMTVNMIDAIIDAQSAMYRVIQDLDRDLAWLEGKTTTRAPETDKSGDFAAPADHVVGTP